MVGYKWMQHVQDDSLVGTYARRAWWRPIRNTFVRLTKRDARLCLTCQLWRTAWISSGDTECQDCIFRSIEESGFCGVPGSNGLFNNPHEANAHEEVSTALGSDVVTVDPIDVGSSITSNHLLAQIIHRMNETDRANRRRFWIGTAITSGLVIVGIVVTIVVSP